MLCEACQKKIRGDRPVKCVERVHHVTKEDFLQAVREHCQICNFLLSKLPANSLTTELSVSKNESFTPFIQCSFYVDNYPKSLAFRLSGFGLEWPKISEVYYRVELIPFTCLLHP